MSYVGTCETPSVLLIFKMTLKYDCMKDLQYWFVHQNMHFLKICISSKYVFHQNMHFIKICISSKYVFHQNVYFIKICISSKYVFHQNIMENLMVIRVEVIAPEKPLISKHLQK